MNYGKKLSLASMFCVLLMGGAQAKVSEEEAARLGKDLTPVGAIKAGNADGTIPEWTGGLSEAPASYDPSKPGIRPNPFPDDKPRLVIDHTNMEEHADKLSDSVKELMKRYPDFRIDVYPTRRTASYPDYIIERTRASATSAEAVDGGLVLKGAKGGYPFPIPQTGFEVMWNKMLRFMGGEAYSYMTSNYLVGQDGSRVLFGRMEGHVDYPYHNIEKPDENYYIMVDTRWLAPRRVAGEAVMLIDALDMVNVGRRSWSYLPGQRRVKLNPNNAYDAPNPGTGGLVTMDDAMVFYGPMDRYEFKLVGKKEMYIPYNNYKLMYESTADEAFTKGFLNPDVVRWELHRVWAVEATLKDGQRHVYHRRMFYFDEDSYTAGIADNFDAEGNLFRSTMGFAAPSYERKGIYGGDVTVHYDFAVGAYAMLNFVDRADPQQHGALYRDRYDQNYWTPAGLASRGVR